MGFERETPVPDRLILTGKRSGLLSAASTSATPLQDHLRGLQRKLCSLDATLGLGVPVLFPPPPYTKIYPSTEKGVFGLYKDIGELAGSGPSSPVSCSDAPMGNPQTGFEHKSALPLLWLPATGTQKHYCLWPSKHRRAVVVCSHS